MNSFILFEIIGTLKDVIIKSYEFRKTKVERRLSKSIPFNLKLIIYFYTNFEKKEYPIKIL